MGGGWSPQSPPLNPPLKLSHLHKVWSKFYPKLPFSIKFKNKQNGWIRSWFRKDVLIGKFPSKSVKVFRKIGWVSIPSKSIKVFNAGLHDQRTLLKKTVTKFLIENFDHVNRPLNWNKFMLFILQIYACFD